MVSSMGKDFRKKDFSLRRGSPRFGALAHLYNVGRRCRSMTNRCGTGGGVHTACGGKFAVAGG